MYDNFNLQVGDIEEVRLIREKSGRIKGYAYIQFYQKQSVEEAINTLHKSKLDGRTILVERSQSSKDVRGHVGFTVFIKNLSYKVTDEDLREQCEAYGEVKKLTLVKDEKGRSKGLAFVEFIDQVRINL